MLYTSSRGGWLGMASGAFVFVLIYRHSLFNLARAIYSRPILRIVIALSAVVAVVVVSAIAMRQWSHATHAPTIASSREEFWPRLGKHFCVRRSAAQGYSRIALPIWLRSPFPARNFFNQAHGLVFNLLSETGLIGLGAAIFALIVFVKNVGQVANSPDTESHWRAAALASLGGTFAHQALSRPRMSTHP